MHALTNVRTLLLALGDDTTHAGYFTIDHRNIGASYITEAHDSDFPIVPLDVFTMMGELQVDFIKVDAEGFEPYILRGAVETIRRQRPTLLIEIDTRALGFQEFTPQDIYYLLDQFGYQYDRFDGPHGDVLCLPKEKA